MAVLSQERIVVTTIFQIVFDSGQLNRRRTSIDRIERVPAAGMSSLDRRLSAFFACDRTNPFQPHFEHQIAQAIRNQTQHQNSVVGFWAHKRKTNIVGSPKLKATGDQPVQRESRFMVGDDAFDLGILDEVG